MKKIVVIGPESTGKSSLCAQLAEHYQSQWVREYAREYLLTNGKDYRFEDLLTIAKGQLKGEDAVMTGMAGSASPVFIDTDMHVMQVWSEFVFNRCDHWILNRIVERQYDLYLLCSTDLPWVKDELREYPDLPIREKLFQHYKEIMLNQPVPWVEISGDYENRLQQAIAAIDALPVN